jgi:hypothetical protein
MNLQSSYNCVLSGVYNYLMLVHNEQFPFEYIYLTEDFFGFIHYDGCLVAQHPEKVSLSFLNQAGFEMVFPAIPAGSGQEVFDFVDTHLLDKGPLPMAINLRYSVLDPTNFDQDYWNFQMIVKSENRYGYKMFDMFHGKYYEMDKEHLQKAIRTSFNYRLEGEFTPFMILKRINAEPVSSVIQTSIPELVRSAIKAYNLEKQKEEVDKFLEELKERYLNHKATSLYNKIYRVMGYQVIIANSRKQFLKTLQSAGCYQKGKLDEWISEWEKLNQSVAGTIGRRSIDEYRSLRDKFYKVLNAEFELLSEVIEKGVY